MVMQLLDLLERAAPPKPWGEGDNIPWNDPGFSERMLKEHLCQDHDAASRRGEIIDRHVDWVHTQVLSGESANVLDLCCGPGLYTSRLAGMGHECFGIDYSPASIAYAAEEARRLGLRCEYRREDVRQADYGAGFDLVMLINGEFNVFRPDDARGVLRKCHSALTPGGLLLLEPHTHGALRSRGGMGSSWYAAQSGLFSDHPHLVLEESFWDAGAEVATTRHIVVMAATAEVSVYAASYQAYTEDGYRSVLEECGFRDVRFHASLTGVDDQSSPEYLVILAQT
jgi:SAM-dependent methyltransferase